jgi:hypothetical protein
VAARRLIAVMLVLLFLSSLAAALAPVENTTNDEPPPPTPPASATVANTGKLVRATLDAGAKPPDRVTAHVGDQLQLRVTGPRPDTVDIPAFGATADLDPVAPAMFDLLLDRKGRFTVRLLEERREAGTIVVRTNPPARKERAGDRAPDRS